MDSDRYIRLEGIERLPLPNLPEFENALPGYRLHTLQVQLRKYGDARKTSTHDVSTVYPHCPLDREATSVFFTGQLMLPIPAAVLEVPEPVNPVVVVWKPKRQAKPKLGIQLNLPVTGLEAELNRLRSEKHPNLPPVSSQELLAQKVKTWSLQSQKEFELPQVVVDLLQNLSATEQEWESVIDLFGVIGLSGVLQYIKSIPTWRKRKGIPVSTAVASTSVVPARTTTKSNTISVKVVI